MNIKNKKWKTVLIALFIILFSLALRLDLNNTYPKGADTYELYILSTDVREKGYVVWNIDFLTSIGMTSISYPSGGIVFLTGLSSMIGLDNSSSTIIWNVLLIIIAALLLYIISKEIFHNKIVSMLTVLIYLNTRFFVSYSTFFTSRNILHIFFLSIIFLLIKDIKVDFKKSSLIIALLTISFFTHRATIIIAVFLIAYIISKIMYKIYRNTIFTNILMFFVGAIIFISSIYFFGHINIGSETTRIPFNTGMTFLDDLLSIVFSLSMHFGLLIILIPLGYTALLLKGEKSYKDMFILTSITLALGFIVETIYFFYLFLPLMTILTSYFIKHIITGHNKILKNALIFIVVLALIIPIYVTVRESKSDNIYVREQTAMLAKFLEDNNIEKSIACNNHFVYCSQISSISKNIKALTSASGRTIIDKVVITDSNINLANLRSKIFYRENIIGTSFFSDTYTSALINWNTPKPIMEKLMEITNLGYIIDSRNEDSMRNRAKIDEKFPNTNQVYDNGLQQIKVIR